MRHSSMRGDFRQRRRDGVKTLPRKNRCAIIPASSGQLAQLVRAPRSHRGSHRFKSYIAHLKPPHGAFLFEDADTRTLLPLHFAKHLDERWRWRMKIHIEGYEENA